MSEGNTEMALREMVGDLRSAGVDRLTDRAKSAVIDALPDGIVVVSGPGRIVYANRRFVALFGREAGQIQDRSVEDLLPGWRELASRALHPTPPGPSRTPSRLIGGTATPSSWRSR